MVLSSSARTSSEACIKGASDRCCCQNTHTHTHTRVHNCKPQNMLQFIAALLYLCSVAVSASVRGRLDLGPRNISREDVARTEFTIYQIGNLTDQPYTTTVHLDSLDGTFEFSNVPLAPGANESTYFVLYPRALDYNLKPNRILVELIKREGSAEPTVRAYKNVFGKEYFPSPEILYPETLEAVAAEPYITITTVNTAPVRQYVQARNIGIFQSGPLASIVNSRYKMAGVITLVMLLVFPMIVEKFDPETAEAIKEHKRAKATGRAA